MGQPLLYVGTHATDDPTKAALPFLAATGAAAAEIDCTIALLGEGVYLVKEPIASTVLPVGFKPLKELMAQVIEAKIPIFV